MFLALVFALGASAIAIAAPGGTVVGDSVVAGDPGLAQTGAVGLNGFPEWYKDKAGVRIEPCLDPTDPLCIMGALPDPNAPITPNDVTGNFPDEMFYQAAGAGLANVGRNVGTAAKPLFGKATLDASLEGAFLNGPPKPGDQMVFARLRVRVTDGLTSGATYRFVHPYGMRDIQVDPNESSLFVTEDIGATAGVFSEALNGRIAPFLKWDPAIAPAAPAGYIGDPGADHPVVGGRETNAAGQNYFAIIGPGVGANRTADNTCPAEVLAKGIGGTASVNDCIYTNLFSLMGKKAVNAGIDVKRATYSRTAAGSTTVDVTADSDAGQSIVVQDANATRRLSGSPLIPNTKLIGDGEHYYAQVAPALPFPSGTDTQLELVNATDAGPQAHKLVTPVDEILNASALFTSPTPPATTGTVALSAKSSDATLAATDLYVVDPATKAHVAFSAPTGTATLPTASLTVTVPPATVTIGSTTGGGSITVPVQIADPPGPSTDAPLKADAGADVSAKPNVAVKLFATGSTGAITSYSWGGPADETITGADTEAAVVTPPVPPTAAPVTYTYTLSLNGGAATDSVDVTVDPNGAGAPPGVTDVLTPVRQRYRVDQQRLVIDGTASVLANNQVTIWLGPTVGSGTRLGTVGVSPTGGAFTFDTGRGSNVVIPACRCVSYSSTQGGKQENLAITIQGGVLPAATTGAAAPAAPAAPAPAAAAPAVAAAVPAARLATAPLTAAVAAPAAIRATTIAATGLAVTVNVPTGATLLRLRVTTAGGKGILRTFRKVKAGRVKVRLRSAKLRQQLRAGRRYRIEVRVGTSRGHLGAATVKQFRVR